MLISAAKGVLSLKIDLSTQTGLRPCEIQGDFGLEVRDIHFDSRTVTARIHKGCNARPPLRIIDELCARLQTYIYANQLQPEDLLFNMSSKKYGESYRCMRNRLAAKMEDLSIKTIRLYDLRHYYVTKQLHRCQNAEKHELKLAQPDGAIIVYKPK